MKKGPAYLLSIIADGRLHSGEELALQLEISRAAIWKSIKQLQTLGLLIEAVQSKGYRLAKPIELFSENKIRKSLTAKAKKSCRNIELLFKTESTNTFLFQTLATQQIHGNVVLAEYQTHGRGRRGNTWLSPLAGGITFSVGWHFEIAPKTIGLLSLYTGVAIARALTTANVSDVGLKWPNDIVVNEKKIGGILLEVRGEASGPVDVVIGIGLNYNLGEDFQSSIEQPVTDICHQVTQSISRNNLVALLLSNIFQVLEDISNDHNLNLLNEWRKFDCYKGRHAKLMLPHEEIEGVLQGVDDQGALLLAVDDKVLSYTSGEISLRVQ